MRTSLLLSALLLVGLPACEPTVDLDAFGSNPFLDNQANLGKDDTAYVNPDGIEVEIDIEADVQASSYNIRRAPALLGQYAMTYLLKRGQFYLESLAEDSSSAQRVEWLIDGEWRTDAEARSVASAELTHFRIRGINAVLLHRAASGVEQGTEFAAEVPVKPYDVMSDAGDACADPDNHMTLSQSIYWYQWNPDRSGCEIDTQQMSVTVSRMFQSGPTPYPEFDQLVADGKVTAVVLFGQIGDEAEISDYDFGMRGYRAMAQWLLNAGYQERDTELGRRFGKLFGEIDYEIDLYSPHEFAGLGDHANFGNFQTALSTHEIVVYDGHSMLGASDFWTRPDYPAFYQIFLYGGCLGYEYYIRPILEGKGGWDTLDIMSSVIEVSAGAMDFAGPILAKIGWALENDYEASWNDLLVAVRRRVGDSTFGASGVRDNCFTPTGSRCSGAPSGDEQLFENTTAIQIPDNDPAGIASLIEVPISLTPSTVRVRASISHSYIGDLQVTLTRDGQTVTLHDRDGGSTDDLVLDTDVSSSFTGANAEGRWTLTVSDHANIDTGTLESWAVVLGE